jgi:hypothetical protein
MLLKEEGDGLILDESRIVLLAGGLTLSKRGCAEWASAVSIILNDCPSEQAIWRGEYRG